MLIHFRFGRNENFGPKTKLREENLLIFVGMRVAGRYIILIDFFPVMVLFNNKI